MGLLVAFFLVSILVSFACSILEAVLLSVTPAYIGMREQDNPALARDLARFKEDIDRPLSAILTLNTIAHTVGAIGVGAQAAAVFGDRGIVIFGQFGFSFEALIAGLMTLAVLVLSEVIPKTLGANNWEALAPYAAPTLKALLVALMPFIWLSQFITRKLKKDKNRPVLTRSEFAVMAELGKETGAIDESEQKIISNLLDFNRVFVKDIMTPRMVAVTASAAATARQFHEANRKLPFSRIPVYWDNENDSIIGYVMKDDVLLNLVNGHGERRLDAIKRDIIVVHETLPIPDLLTQFIERKEQIALVVDEFGGMEGIVTLEDIMETLLGMEIMDESDNAPDLQLLARRNWEQRAKHLGIVTDEYFEAQKPPPDAAPDQPKG